MQKSILFTLTLAGLLLQPLKSQTCGCGGAPLLGSLQRSATPQGQWQLEWRYEHNEISDLVVRSRRVDPDGRWQRTRALMMDASVGLTSRLSLTALLTLIDKERVVERITADRLRVRGMGDGIVLLKYTLFNLPVFPRQQFSLGAGLKFPLGRSDLTTNGRLVSPDMQPGSGAWDQVLWGFYSRNLPTRAFSSIALSGSHRFTGTNRRYGTDQAGYTFGSETVATLSLSRALSNRFGATVALQYRVTAADRFGATNLPNSGGTWINLEPAVSVDFGAGVTLRMAGQVPLYRNLNGALQLTTRFGVSASVQASFGKLAPPPPNVTQ